MRRYGIVLGGALIGFLFWFAPLRGEEQTMKPRIAVLNIAPSGVSQELAVSVTDLLSTELVNTKMFEVVERMQVAKILNEQGFQQTGVTDSAAAAEVGKLLNTKRVVIGTLGKLGKKLVITIKIVDVEKANILFAEKEMANGEEDLVGACEELAYKLVFNITGIKIKNRKTTRISETSPATPAAAPAATPAPETASAPAPVQATPTEPKKEEPKKKKPLPIIKKEEKDPVRRHSQEAIQELDTM